jgi:NADP-dependent 3-hydroxy acid dehydrogenase YdfG
MTNTSPWAGKRVWITGASSGIGEAVVRHMAAMGAHVALSGRSSDSLEAIVRGLPGGPHLALALDMRDAAAASAAVQRIVTEWGGIDLALLNAGTYQPMRGYEIDLPAARSLLDTNLMGTLNCVAAATSAMLAAGKGQLAIVASVAGYRGLPKAVIYGASKAALINLAETLRLDLGPRGIKVQLINPGFVKTPLTDQNDFKMPALITPDQAATEIVAGLNSERFEIHFPKRFTRLLKFLRLLPYGLYFPLIRRITGL